MADLAIAHRRSSSSSATVSRRKPSSFRSTWCCSFTVPPSSPDVRSTFTNPTKPPQKSSYNGSIHSSPSPSSKLGLGIIDPRRILSPGRVSPIDSDPPFAPLSETADPVGSAVIVVESVNDAVHPPVEEREEPDAVEKDGSLDLRMRVKGNDGRVLVLELDSRVLCESSEYFRAMVMGARRKDVIEVDNVDDLVAFRETIEMMYEEDLSRWLMKAGVSKSIDVLEVSSKIMFGRGVTSCLNYIEAVPWSESDEDKLKNLFARCTFDEAVTNDILGRLQPEGPGGSEALAVQLIHSIADGTNGYARKELQSLVNGLLSKSSVYQKDLAGLSKESLYDICHSCLNSLAELFKEASGSTHSDCAAETAKTKPLVERISKQIENLNWLLEILIDRQMAEDFVCLWANKKELAKMHQKASPMVRYELSRISASVFVAMGKGKLRCPGDVRFAILELWFGPMLLDFGWLQRCSKGLDIRMLEEGLGQAILTLSMKQQQSLFVEWFRCFGGKGTECPNLSKAFQVWWRRSFVRSGSADGRS